MNRDLHTLHDAGVIIAPRTSLAHSLSDELPPARPVIEPVIGGWREVREILAGFVVLALLGVAGWLWLAIGSASQVPVR